MNSRSLRGTRRRARARRLFLIFSGIVALWIVTSWAARSLDARGGNAKTLTLHADMQAGDVIVYRYSDKPAVSGLERELKTKRQTFRRYSCIPLSI